MTKTQNLELPLIAAAQAQKHITHNEALATLDTVVQLCVISAALNAPPSSPSQGDRYIVSTNPSGGWEGQNTQIALFDNGVWVFIAPQTGWRVWDAETAALLIWHNQTWQALASEQSQSLTHGINAQADTQNRLVVASPASLFNHEGHGHQLKINKNNDTDVASVLFQSGFSGRAEITANDADQLEIKTSSDGETFHSAIQITNQTGETYIPGLKFPSYWRWYAASTQIVTDTDGDGKKLRLDMTSHNPGSAYNTQTGDFTVPHDGIYLINVNFNTHGNVQFNCDIRVNEAVVSRIQFFPNNYSHLSKTFLLPLTAGDVLAMFAVGAASVRFDGGGIYDNVSLLRLGLM